MPELELPLPATSASASSPAAPAAASASTPASSPPPPVATSHTAPECIPYNPCRSFLTNLAAITLFYAIILAFFWSVLSRDSPRVTLATIAAYGAGADGVAALLLFLGQFSARQSRHAVFPGPSRWRFFFRVVLFSEAATALYSLQAMSAETRGFMLVILLALSAACCRMLDMFYGDALQGAANAPTTSNGQEVISLWTRSYRRFLSMRLPTAGNQQQDPNQIEMEDRAGPSGMLKKWWPSSQTYHLLRAGDDSDTGDREEEKLPLLDTV